MIGEADGPAGPRRAEAAVPYESGHDDGVTEPTEATDAPVAETDADEAEADEAEASEADASEADADGAPGPAVSELPPVTERELAARRRGLASAYIDGGEDPDPERTHREEARFIRLLVIMVIAIVGSSLVVTFVGLIVAGPAR